MSRAESRHEETRARLTMHILLIEDDTKTGEYLKKGLGESGYNVDWTQHGADGLHLYTMNRPAIAATIMERLG